MTQNQTRILWIAVFLGLIMLGVFGPKNEVSADPVIIHDSEEIAPDATQDQTTAESKTRVKAKRGDYFTSPAGIKYGKDYSGRFESRLAHIMAHTKPDPSKPKHSMFRETSRERVIMLLDEAWKKRGPPERQGGGKGRDVYDVSMGRNVGTEGERRIRLVTEADSAQIITAYPVR